jgi:hypothetical protein
MAYSLKEKIATGLTALGLPNAKVSDKDGGGFVVTFSASENDEPKTFTLEGVVTQKKLEEIAEEMR